MCIISGPVVSVNSTKIFVAPSRDGTRQITVYRNAVNTADTNVMCLPVPTPATIQFEHVARNLFQQCQDSFVKARTRSDQSLGLSAAPNRRSFLNIQNHGSYEVVVAPSAADLERISPQFATLTPDVKAFLSTSYPASFGFLLCRLRPGLTDYEPFAYSHDLEKPGRLFVPTKHFHMDTFGADHADDWDHQIYSACTGMADHDSATLFPKPQNLIAWLLMPANFELGQNYPLRLLERAGQWPNQDLVFRCSADVPQQMPVGLARTLGIFG